MKAPELKERLEESEKLIQDMTVTWEDKLRKTEAIAQVATHKTAYKTRHRGFLIAFKSSVFGVIS